ncbi:unnamed protein product [Medioppia subpectinata]|uniref:C2H2-type domain-containing protein n=1 Tax=Medioppia subpectinata TaxID=1979941 RepID=A0A7R9KGB8_9ACAR|nr:unnamed protein product [Medioppia subpectinata]CAG2103016.1 unnamed protein product [Medioppia subpectinata]
MSLSRNGLSQLWLLRSGDLPTKKCFVSQSVSTRHIMDCLGATAVTAAEVMATDVVMEDIETPMDSLLTDGCVFDDKPVPQSLTPQQTPIELSEELVPTERPLVSGAEESASGVVIDDNMIVVNNSHETSEKTPTNDTNASPVVDTEDCKDGLIVRSGRSAAMDRSLRSSHVREVHQLKTEVQKLKTELTQFRRQKTNVRLKNKKLNQLKAENEKLSNELLFSHKINEILTKFKHYFEERFALMNDNCLQSDQNLVDLQMEYKNTLNERQTIDALNKSVDLKYKLFPDLNNSKNNATFGVNKTTFESIIAKRQKSRGRPRKLDTLDDSAEGMAAEMTASSVKRAAKHSFKCTYDGCAYQCTRSKMLSEHINSAHTGDRPYVCPMTDCNKSFARSNTLDVHLKSCHSDLRRYRCTWEGCNAALKTKLGLSIHLQRHSGEKQFRCEWPGCSYRGMTKQRLEIHIMNHTGERPYKCMWPGCDANFTSSDCLRSHQKSHSNNRPYRCDWPGCDSAFKANRALTIHKVIHTNEKVFRCIWENCEFRCNRYHILATHRLSHTGGKKFGCSWPGCESKFDRRNKLEMHLMIHRGDKPHKCEWPGCEKRFVEKGNMRKHYNSVHSKA